MLHIKQCRYNGIAPASYLGGATKMPRPSVVSSTLREALIECFRATARLLQSDRRRQLVLVGGAASIAHSSC